MAQHGRWLAIHNATIYTMDSARPRAQALAARDGRIVAVGSNDEVREVAGRWRQVETIDARGVCVLPGLTDCHIHFLSYGLNRQRVDVAGTRTLDEIVDRVRARTAEIPAGAWVLGHGWDHTLWPDPRFPTREVLDRAAPAHPVALRRKDGHLLWVNTRALVLAGVTSETPDPPGGRIGRNAATGQPTGLFFEDAQRLVGDVIPPPTLEEAQAAILQAQEHALRCGLTGIHVPEQRLSFRAFQQVERTGKLRLRVTHMLWDEGLAHAIATGVETGFGSPMLRVGPVKLFLDGSLGSETAAMLEPFEGQPGNRGILTLSPDVLDRTVRQALEAGLGIAMHAIGDRANRVALDVLARHQPPAAARGLRSRIEHVQLLHADDLPRLAAHGIVASMQPIHATSDYLMADRLWGARSRGAYAFRSLLRTGATLAFGSDAPVETPDPLQGIYAAVTRQRPDGDPPGGWYAEERLTAEEAVRAYTTGAAFATHEEGVKGSLAPGRYCDLTVLSEDVIAGPARASLDAVVRYTVVDGEIAYAAE